MERDEPAGCRFNRVYAAAANPLGASRDAAVSTTHRVPFHTRVADPLHAARAYRKATCATIFSLKRGYALCTLHDGCHVVSSKGLSNRVGHRDASDQVLTASSRHKRPASRTLTDSADLLPEAAIQEFRKRSPRKNNNVVVTGEVCHETDIYDTDISNPRGGRHRPPRVPGQDLVAGRGRP